MLVSFNNNTLRQCPPFTQMKESLASSSMGPLPQFVKPQSPPGQASLPDSPGVETLEQSPSSHRRTKAPEWDNWTLADLKKTRQGHIQWQPRFLPDRRGRRRLHQVDYFEKQVRVDESLRTARKLACVRGGPLAAGDVREEKENKTRRRRIPQTPPAE